MEFKGNQAQQSTNPGRPIQGSNVQWNHSSNKMRVAAVIAGIILLVGGIALWLWKANASEMAVMNNRYQALFLTNGQVYFGKISNVGEKYVTLKDIYYLQVQQAVQPAQQQDKNAQSPQVSLAKLGSELHGPEDQMQVNRDQVLFWENLKDDSKVVTAIKDNKK